MATPAALTLAGMGLMAIATLCFGAMTVLIRVVPGGLPVFELVFFRNLFALAWLVPWEGRRGWAVLRTGRFGLHLLRAALNSVVMLTFFKALLITPMAQAVALSYVSPLFSTLLAVLVLRERLPRHRALAALAGFAGAMVILRPGAADFQPGLLLILLSASFWAATVIVIKVLVRTESSATITIYMALLMTPMTGLLALSTWVAPAPAQLGWLALVALSGVLGQYAMASALGRADITAILPMDFLRLVWSALGAFWLFAEVPDAMTLLGGVVIFVATSYQALEESR